MTIPALDRPVVERGVPPDLLDLAQPPVGEQVLVQRGEATHAATSRAHSDLAREFGPGLVEGEAPVAGDAERPAAVGPPIRRAPQILRQHLEFAVERDEGDLRIPLVIVLEVDAAPVGGPHRAGDASVEGAREDACPAPVQAHDLELAHLVGARAVLVADEGDPSSVGGDADSGRVGAVRELSYLPVRDRDDVEFGIAVVVDPVLVPVRREDEAPSVRSPRGGALMLEVARRHLSGRPPLDRDDEDVVIPEVQIADAVLPVLEAVLHDGGIGPLRAGGRLRRRGQARRRVRNPLVERDVAPVRRPAEPAGRLDELRERGLLAGVHPADADLAVRRVGDPRPVGRPPRGRARPDPPVIRSVGVHDPQLGLLPVPHDVHRRPDVDDLPAVRGDPGVRRILEFEHVHGLEVLLRDRRLGDQGTRGGEQRQGDPLHPASLIHLQLPAWLATVNGRRMGIEWEQARKHPPDSTGGQPPRYSARPAQLSVNEEPRFQSPSPGE